MNHTAFHSPIQIDKLQSIPGHWSQTSPAIENLEAQIDMLREARRESTHAYERDEIESRRSQLRKQLIAARRALWLQSQPVRPSFFRRFVAALLSR